jgi:hypothetical protein
MSEEDYYPKQELAEIAELNQRIATLEAQLRWIPVSEGLPEEKQRVIVFLDNGLFNIGHLGKTIRQDSGYKNQWLTDDNWYFNVEVTHWIPLPNPPEEKA